MNNAFHYPAMMSDGRINANWQPTAVLNENIRKREGIKSNWDYRIYLQKNADSIIQFDQAEACKETNCSYSTTKIIPEEVSDLKEYYLSRQELQKQVMPKFYSSSLSEL
jgi:hypothetical protein